MDYQPTSRLSRYMTMVLAIVIMGFCAFGFGSKFVEFVALAKGDVEGSFAITPVVNYLLASLGFLCLFVWAMMGGMFNDVERPKYTMLENEEQLDRRSSGY